MRYLTIAFILILIPIIGVAKEIPLGLTDPVSKQSYTASSTAIENQIFSSPRIGEQSIILNLSTGVAIIYKRERQYGKLKGTYDKLGVMYATSDYYKAFTGGSVRSAVKSFVGETYFGIKLGMTTQEIEKLCDCDGVKINKDDRARQSFELKDLAYPGLILTVDFASNKVEAVTIRVDSEMVGSFREAWNLYPDFLERPLADLVANGNQMAAYSKQLVPKLVHNILADYCDDKSVRIRWEDLDAVRDRYGVDTLVVAENIYWKKIGYRFVNQLEGASSLLKYNLKWDLEAHLNDESSSLEPELRKASEFYMVERDTSLDIWAVHREDVRAKGKVDNAIVYVYLDDTNKSIIVEFIEKKAGAPLNFGGDPLIKLMGLTRAQAEVAPFYTMLDRVEQPEQSTSEHKGVTITSYSYNKVGIKFLFNEGYLNQIIIDGNLFQGEIPFPYSEVVRETKSEIIKEEHDIQLVYNKLDNSYRLRTMQDNPSKIAKKMRRLTTAQYPKINPVLFDGISIGTRTYDDLKLQFLPPK